jgi:hypothetical protein
MIKKLKILLGVETKQAEKNIGNVSKKIKSVGVGGKIAQGGLNLMSTGFKKVGLAMKAAGIGLFIALLTQLTDLFGKNQKTADTFQRIMIKLQPVMDAVGKVVEVLAVGLEKMVDWISQAISWIGDLIGVSTSFGTSVKVSADALVNQRKQVQLLEAELGLLQLQYQREAELMRQIRDDESQSIDDRIAANYELGKVLDEQARKERYAAEQSLYLAELELRMNKENIDLQVAVTNAKTKLAEIDERITGQRSEQLTNLNSLERERVAQQKEASAKREEQLKKEAEMLQELIDLQNEDIKVKQKANRDLNAQFKNAEEANAEILKQLKEKLKAELNGLNASVKNAKTNIELQKEQSQMYKSDIEEKEKLEEERKNKVLNNIDEEFQALLNTSAVYDVMIEGNEKKDTESLNFKKTLNKAIKENDITTLEGIDQTIAAFEQQANAMTSHLSDPGYHKDLSSNVDKIINKQLDALLMMREKVAKELESETDLFNEATKEQLEISEQSTVTSQNIIATSAEKKLEIEEKYAKEIEELEKSLGVTKEQLQLQADQELFLHFEEAQKKEIRLANEKYDRLLGLAQGNAEATEKLEKQKTEALETIEQKYIDEQEQAKTEFYKYIEVEELNVREKELNALQSHLDKILEIEGLTDQQRLEAEEEYIRQYDEVTDRHRAEDLEKEKENKRKMTDLALNSMNSIVNIAGLGAQKEIAELEKKFKNGAISEEKFNKQKNQIEGKQRKKEKKAALAQIAIDTGRQISSAYTAALSAAAAAGPGAPVVTPMLVAQMLAIVFAGVAQAKGALGVSGGGGAEGGVDGGSDVDGDMGAGAVPRINFGAAGNEQPPVQAFVVETDISNAQALQSELDLQSTL